MAEPECDFGHEIKAQFPYIKAALDDLNEKVDRLNGRLWKLLGSLVLITIGAVFASIWRG